jgi:tetratricopeptide (TPR) repeat protein
VKLAQLLMRRSAWDEALDIQRKGTAAIERVTATVQSTVADRALLADSYLTEGKALYQGGHSPSLSALQAGLARFRQTLALREELSAAEPGNLERMRKVSAAHSYVGYAQWAIGDLTHERSDYEAALDTFTKSYKIAQMAAATQPADIQAQRSLGASLADLAEKQAFLGDPIGGRDRALEALEVMKKIAQSDPANLEAQRDVGESHLMVADACQRLNELDQAREHCSAAVEILARIHQLDSVSTETTNLLTRARQQMTALESPVR